MTGASMVAFVLLVPTLGAAASDLPRECLQCGVYAGPNTALVVDPYLRRADIWPEFYPSTCRFEVARGSFVALSRAACAGEATYRNGRA